MGNNGSSGEMFDFVCFRCRSTIKPGEKMFTMSVSLETPEDDGTVNVNENYAISSLCLGCASVILVEAVLDKKLTMPGPLFEELEERRGIILKNWNKEEENNK
ncbi:MAG: hypothetical protein COS87_02865 [Chloroflexi bacterium CG07_land_8_20_14_0_80_45_17]|nr:MAG: hypothetical protein COX14_03415 [Chloroflexi bacterium CG23_combo_of_CG06-09_8_20_14_all_45_10]PIU56186.1 MAG: hypothetical protein COS87_02865 [Chloroflexi bacterium CG07_land_8_20_14_0_80_45_17]